MRKTIFFVIVLIISPLLSFAQSIDLQKCRELAIKNSFASKEASLNVKAAQYQLKEARAEFLPRLNFNSFAFRSLDPLVEIGINDIFEKESRDLAYAWAFENGFKNNYAIPKYGYFAGFSLIQPLFTGLRIVKGNQLATLGVKAANLQKDVQKRDTFKELDEYFWQTVSLEDKLQTLDSFKDLLESLYKDVNVALSSGLITEDDYLQVKLKQSELLATEIKLKNGIKLSKMNLLNFIGYDYEFLKLDSIQICEDKLELDPPTNFYRSEAQVADNLEEMALLSLNVQAKQLQKQMELGQTLPQVIVGASYYYSALGEHDKHNGIAFAAITIPISDWWKASQKQNRLQTEVDKAIAQREYLSNQIILLVRKTWVELCSAWEEEQVALEALHAAEYSYNKQKAHYDAGLITLSELLQSYSTFQQCSSNECDARIAYKKSLQTWKDLL